MISQAGFENWDTSLADQEPTSGNYIFAVLLWMNIMALSSYCIFDSFSCLNLYLSGQILPVSLLFVEYLWNFWKTSQVEQIFRVWFNRHLKSFPKNVLYLTFFFKDFAIFLEHVFHRTSLDDRLWTKNSCVINNIWCNFDCLKVYSACKKKIYAYK